MEEVIAEWIEIEDTFGWYYCSNCQRTNGEKEETCPNCGAKMTNSAKQKLY